MNNIEETTSWLKQLLDSMLIETAVVTSEEIEPNHWRLNIEVDPNESSMLIGYRGDGLAAIQHLLRLIFNNQDAQLLEEGAPLPRLTLNINNYIEDKTDRLGQSAARAAHKVLETGRPYRFRSLSSSERFIIHNEIAQNPESSDLESFSENDETGRVLIIQYKASLD